LNKKLFAFLALFLTADLLSKIWAIHSIPPLHWGPYPFGGIGLLPNLFGITFSLNYITNTGAAWGIFAGYATLLFLLRMAIIAGLFVYLVRQKSARWPLWLILTGALGNAIDYCLYGHVIDFLHFTFWGHSFPIFNLSDSYITLGVLALLFLPSSNRKLSIL
jgi:lipoprotein signal peptidase